MNFDAISICLAINFVRNNSDTILVQMIRESQRVFLRLLELRRDAQLILSADELLRAEERKDDAEASLEREEELHEMPMLRYAVLSAQSRAHSAKRSYKASLSTGVMAHIST